MEKPGSPEKPAGSERPGGSDRTAGGESKTLFRGGGAWLLLLLLAMLSIALFANQGPTRSTITTSFFEAQLAKGNVAEIVLRETEGVGKFVEAPLKPVEEGAAGKPEPLQEHFRVALPTSDVAFNRLLEKIEAAKIPYDVEHASQTALNIFWMIVLLLPVAVLVAMWISMRRSRGDMLGGGFLSGFSRSPARRYEGSKQPITFNDVAGLEGVKADLLEIVDYLKSPEKFQKLGGRVPKGVLLAGPPGTGKTLLARAVAGEAGVPFFSVNGSEFIQMFVGVGASRVRDLFATAKAAAPAIMFIDEIDAVGRQRGAGLGGGHDEREQTLNQILGEMDGFAQNDSVIVMAATNRPDVLDPALLRPGRFDRHITVGRPTLKGRLEIFKVHVRDVPLGDDVDLARLAGATVGLTGADIRNLVNEAALWAARNDKTRVSTEDFDYAFDKVVLGAKREEVISVDEKEKIAYHEAGHALLGWILPGANPVHKVTIIPRGRMGGATLSRPHEDRMTYSSHQIRDHLAMLMGGRAAELLVYDDVNVGAERDLEQATSLARRMVMSWGMSDRLGPVSYKLSDEDPFLGRELHQQRQFSEHTMETIDVEVSKILHSEEERARNLLAEHRGKLDALVAALQEREELDERELTEILGPSVHPAPAHLTEDKPVAPPTASHGSGEPGANGASAAPVGAATAPTES